MITTSSRFPLGTADRSAHQPARWRTRRRALLISVVALASVPPVRAQVIDDSIAIGEPGQAAPWLLSNAGEVRTIATDFFAVSSSFVTAVELQMPRAGWLPPPVPLLLSPRSPWTFDSGDANMPGRILAAINARSQGTIFADRPIDARRIPDTGEPIVRGPDPAQVFAEQHFPRVGRGLDVKAGRFVFQFGAESGEADPSGFVSRAYSFIYGPLTHTGLLTTLRLTDAWSVQDGFVTDTDFLVAPTTDLTYFGSIKCAPPTGRNAILVAYILGNGRFDQAGWPHDPKVFDLTFTHKFSSRFNYTVDSLFGFTTSVPDAGFASWWASVQYVSYVLTPRLTAVGRLEFFDDVQGEFTGFEGLYIVPTLGVNIRPHRFVLIRPEFRFDYNSDSHPFEGKHGLATTALGLAARW